TSVLLISQSGETVDTLAALRKANRLCRPTLAIANVSGSSMAREAMASFPTAAGCERAVPATKSFTAQLLNLYLLTLLAAEQRGTMKVEELQQRLLELHELPSLLRRQIPQWERTMRALADYYGDAENFLYLGRGAHSAIAQEGALKLKESAYLHAEGY